MEQFFQQLTNGLAVGAAYRLAGYDEAEVTDAIQADEVTGIEQ